MVPARSPDGTAVIFGLVASPPKILISSPIGAPAKELVSLPGETDKDFGMLVFSPDGTKILVTVLSGAAFLVDYPSGRMRRLESIQNAYWASWMPDSRHVLLVQRRPENRLVLADTMAAGHEQTVLTDPEPAGNAVVSHDGRRIAFAKRRSGR